MLPHLSGPSKHSPAPFLELLHRQPVERGRIAHARLSQLDHVLGDVIAVGQVQFPAGRLIRSRHRFDCFQVKRLIGWRSAREGMGVEHYALLAVVGGSATGLSATDAWAEPLPVISVNVWAFLCVPDTKPD